MKKINIISYVDDYCYDCDVMCKHSDLIHEDHKRLSDDMLMLLRRSESKYNFFMNIGATLLIVVAIGIVGLMAVPSGQYTWSDIRFIIVGCVISFWVLDFLFGRFK